MFKSLGELFKERNTNPENVVLPVKRMATIVDMDEPLDVFETHEQDTTSERSLTDSADDARDVYSDTERDV